MFRTAIKVTDVGLKLHHPKGGGGGNPIVSSFFFVLGQNEDEYKK